MLVSFDIFDTVLIRKCGQPENVFWLLACRLYPNDCALREDFYMWRRQIEKTTDGTTLADFYHNADELFPLYSVIDLQQAELAVESEQLTVNPRVQQEISRHRKAGDSICFISDMYLPSVFLIDILRREKCLEGSEKVYVSGECHARKDNGGLFDLVREENQPVTQWLHLGDSQYSDVNIARRKGVTASYIDTTYSCMEKKILQFSPQTCHSEELSMLAGISRAARLQSANQADHVLAAEYLAPAYIPYVHWLLKRAKECRVHRLYFLSRDGWILRQIAEAMGTEIECRDLFISRKALALPWLCTHFDGQSFLHLLDGHTLLGRKIDDVLGLLKLSVSELHEYDINYDHERIASRDEEQSFLAQLFTGKLGEYIHELARTARERLLGYLRQEGVDEEGINAEMVDIGWVGTTRYMLNDFMMAENRQPLSTFYYSVRHDCFPCVKGRYEAFYPEGKLSTDLTTVIEHYFSTSIYPSTIDYVHKDGRWIPDWMDGIDTPKNPLAQVNSHVVCQMAREITKYPYNENTLYTWSRLVLDELLVLQLPVNLKPLQQLGNFDGMDFVRKLSLWEVVRLVCFGKRITAWDNASLALSVGFKLKKLLWPVHLSIAKLRRRVYLRLYRCFT